MAHVCICLVYYRMFIITLLLTFFAKRLLVKLAAEYLSNSTALLVRKLIPMLIRRPGSDTLSKTIDHISQHSSLSTGKDYVAASGERTAR